MNTESILTNRQQKTFTKLINVNGKKGRIECTVRYDDRCKNGHNNFSITGEIWSSESSTQDRYMESCGCIHDEIVKHFPKLKHLIKWHLVSSKEPMHYIANTVYHAENGNIDFARSTAVWDDATLEQLKDKQLLVDRLPKLMDDFRADIESLGFVY